MTPAMKRLMANYEMYVENMSEWVNYQVELKDSNGEVVKSTEMIAYNKPHLLIEIAQLYNLEAMNVVTIDIQKM